MLALSPITVDLNLAIAISSPAGVLSVIPKRGARRTTLPSLPKPLPPTLISLF